MKLFTFFLLATTAFAQTDTKPAPTHRDSSYGPHERNKLDVWLAKSEKPAPLLIFIHGGGWAGGDKADVPAKLVTAMLAQGISVASINYRYSTIAPLPAPVHDAARAVQFLRSKAGEWKLDAKRFGAYGISAGGCTTLWVACHDDLADARSGDPVARESTRLQCAVGMSPQTCLEPDMVIGWVGDQILNHAMIARAVGVKKGEDVRKPKPEWVKLLHEFSPITHVSKDDPPILISNPRVDPLPATSAGSAIHHAMLGMKFQERAKAVGATCILRIEAQPSADTPTPEAFLLQHLKPKP